MRKIFKRLTPFAGLVIIAAFCIVGNSVANLNMPALMADIINLGVANGDRPFIMQTGIRMLGVTVFSVCCAVGTSFCSSRLSTGFGASLREDIFKKVQNFSSADIDEFGTASLITRTTNDVMQLQHFVMMLLRSMLSAPVMAIGGVYMAFVRNARLAMIVLVAMPVIVLIVTTVARKSIPLTKLMQKKLDRVNLVMREKLRGVRVIRAFNTDEYECHRFSIANEELTETSIKMQRTMGLMFPLTMLVLNGITVAIIWVGAINVNMGSMMVGDIMAVVEYVMQILMSMMMVSMIFIRIPRAIASVERINAILDKEPKIVDGGMKPDSSLRGKIEFRDVSFSYAGADEDAIKNISFKASMGQTVAIIGGTGSGKTTLLSLIPRFYDTGSGEILIDGMNVRDYNLSELREKIGYVTQKSVLFSGSIADNIGWGKPGATAQEIELAAQIAQATEFIDEREDGLDAEISQGGANVSGGQKQRLSIARAVIRRPEFYLFDDSFSALDFKTDYNLRMALSEQTSDSTVIIVAQRVSTIMSADLILVLENGELVGKGTHTELLQSCDVYREIVYSQLSEEEAAM